MLSFQTLPLLIVADLPDVYRCRPPNADDVVAFLQTNLYPMTRIAIITHEYDDFYESTYFLKEFADIWKEHGLDVKVLKGTSGQGNADLGILHVNLTEIPDNYLQFAKTFPRVINGSVKDISKRKII